jgi:hypothetical protein
VQYSPGDLAGLSDRIIPYQTRVGYFTYAKPLADDRVIAVLPPRFVPGADVRDQVPSLRGTRPAAREEYIDDLYPVIRHVSPNIPSGGGEVSLMGLRFGSAGSTCQCSFGGAAALSCVVKSPELAIIQLPAAPHFHVFREANAQPAFVEVKLVAGNRLGVSRIHFGGDADSDTESSHARALPLPPTHAAASQVCFEAVMHCCLLLAFITVSFVCPHVACLTLACSKSSAPRQRRQRLLPKQAAARRPPRLTKKYPT